MKSKEEYVILLSDIVASTFVVTKDKKDGIILHIRRELERILLQTDFDNIECIYECILDFFTRTDDSLSPEDIEEIARITQLSVSNTVEKAFSMEV